MDITPANTQALFNSDCIPDNTFIHIQPRNNGRMLSGIVRDCRVYPNQILVYVSDLNYVTPEPLDSPSAPKLKQLLKLMRNYEPDLVDEIRKGVDHRPTDLQRAQGFDWPKDRLILPLSDPRARGLMEAPVLVPE